MTTIHFQPRSPAHLFSSLPLLVVLGLSAAQAADPAPGTAKTSEPASAQTANPPPPETKKPTAEELAEQLEAAKKMPADPADWMMRFIHTLRTDTDHQAAYTVKLVEALIKVDRWREAGKIVVTIADYRRKVTLYKLSAEAIRDGDQAASDQWFAEAEGQPEAIRDFERDEILAARLLALGARGHLAEARAKLAGIRPPDLRADTRGRLYEYVPAEKAAAEVQEFLTEEKVSPSVKGRAFLLAAGTLAKAGKTDEAKALAITGIETMCKAADVDTIPLLHRGVLLLVELKDEAAAARWAEVCLGFAERTDARAHWKNRDMRLAAHALQVSGKKAEAEAVLKRIPELTTKLDAISYSRGGMEAASAFLLSDQVELFHKAAVHVLDLTRQHPHHRARGMAAIDVLATYLRQRKELPPEVRLYLDKSARAIEEDPQFQNPV
jgi:hypothetical protein